VNYRRSVPVKMILSVLQPLSIMNQKEILVLECGISGIAVENVVRAIVEDIRRKGGDRRDNCFWNSRNIWHMQKVLLEKYWMRYAL
jgi:hypothetical protein